ncbi:MAG: hypothetical protein ACLRWQ_03565 [Flavonifractor plautii]
MKYVIMNSYPRLTDEYSGYSTARWTPIFEERPDLGAPTWGCVACG